MAHTLHTYEGKLGDGMSCVAEDPASVSVDFEQSIRLRDLSVEVSYFVVAARARRVHSIARCAALRRGYVREA